MTSEKLDSVWIRHWADVYVRNMKSDEQRLLDEIGPAAARRGFYTKAELLAIGRWKANRVIGLLDRNSDADIEDVTRMALAAPLRFRHRVLAILSGVQRPMASALLTIWDPKTHTIIDVNAVSTLHHFGKLPTAKANDVGYVEYLDTCRKIVEQAGDGVTLRDLDRALWKWWDAYK